MGTTADLFGCGTIWNPGGSEVLLSFYCFDVACATSTANVHQTAKQVNPDFNGSTLSPTNKVLKNN